MSTLVGKKIGKYKLLETLGSGGMAQVYRAVQLPLERSVAVKVLHPHLSTQEEFKERFLREAKAIASLQHPHIVQMYDYDYKDNICYMALEFLEGRSLEDRLTTIAEASPDENPQLPLDEALRVTIEVAEALHFAHQQRVVHRDIKPANIMQTADGRTVLTDFGIATILHETRMTVDGGTSGTPSYMSPEQALGERGDERSDIYSLGAVLYQLTTGRLPFEADTLYGLIMKHVNEAPPPASEINPAVPPLVEHIILKAMAKKPIDRYQSAAEFAADLEAVRAGQTIQVALPPTPKPEPESPPQRGDLPQPALWGLAAIAALGIILAAVWFTADSPAPPPEQASAAENAAQVVAEEPDFTQSMAADPGNNHPYSDDFDDNYAGWPLTEGAVVRTLNDGVYQISVEMPDRATATIPEALVTYDKFRYMLDATLVEGQPESGYGLVFHRQSNENYYVFAINGMQQWSIWRLGDGRWQELRNMPNNETWSDSEAVLPPGQTNQLKLEVDHDTFNLFVNDRNLFQLSDPDAPSQGGLIGVYVASSRSANDALARVQIDNLLLEPLDEFTTPSMTNDSP